ncbi:LuxR C-terminal-related transcriptional regulator [Rubinisphaera sp.]|uniref:response regulator transcription factor n=1 Tax=Rubinisphaera sp. TaxID=2024857 RepID=UPI0025D36B09|nr:LuxR C-terminal-related transcriptional regulator [Rubinisphaera sp.]|tara:strand:- start:330 stop:968 length:639 start_codon:yes stop_codon:yes gene_type:complete
MDARAIATVYAINCSDDIGSAEINFLEQQGYQIQLLSTIESLLREINVEEPGCVFVCTKQNEVLIYQLIREFKKRKIPQEIVLIAEHVGIKQAVEVVREGAYTVVELPCSKIILLNTVQETIAKSARKLAKRIELLELTRKFQSLTDDEFEVLEALVKGEGNKQMAHQLDVSSRTIDRRKRALFDKINVDSLADLLLSYIRWSQVDKTVESQ